MKMERADHAKTDIRNSSDGVLAQKCLVDDQEAFEALVKRYSPLLIHSICRIVGDYDEGCDVLQQVLLQLYISLPTLKQDKPLRSWLLHVARNRCLDVLRRRRTIRFSALEAVDEDEEVSLLASMCDPGPLPEEVAEQHDLQISVRRAIDGLPAKYRRVVLMRYVGQKSFAEIARALNIPGTTAKTYFQRAKPLLRAALKGERPGLLASVN